MCSFCKPENFVKGTDGPSSDEMNARIADDLEQQLLECKHFYYCEGKPLMSDARYDQLEIALKRLRPDSIAILGVGCILCGSKE